MERIAFLGIGMMGAGMARRLLESGFAVTVYNRTREKADALKANGARVANSARDAARGADIVISMVADDVASRAVWLGADGALAGARAGMLFIECSTLTPTWVRELAEHARSASCALVDAPVRGGPANAEAGQLNFLVGGEADAFARAEPILSALARKINHVGAVGNGATLKLINNMMGAVQIELFSEAIALAEKMGMDVQRAAEVLLEGAPASSIVLHRAPDILGKNYKKPRFALRLMHKDMSYALDEAARCGVPLPTVAASREIYRLAIARGFGDWDFGAVGEALR